VQALEYALGVRLLNRTARRASLTGAVARRTGPPACR
jgi:DNA-binding transcriptional LysR family regulator